MNLTVQQSFTHQFTVSILASTSRFLSSQKSHISGMPLLLTAMRVAAAIRPMNHVRQWVAKDMSCTSELVRA
jgi:hypothetical protein